MQLRLFQQLKLFIFIFMAFFSVIHPSDVLSTTLDIDKSGSVDATDGVLILRRLNGASTIDTGVVLPNGQTNSTVLITIDGLGSSFDIDKSGTVDATDGVLILRRLNGASTIDTGVVLPYGQTNITIITTIDAFVNGKLQKTSNQVPTISSIANQTTAANTATNAIAFTVGDAETATASLTISGSSSNKTLIPDDNIIFGGSGGSRTVTMTPASGQSGNATITVTVSNGTATASTTFIVMVAVPSSVSTDLIMVTMTTSLGDIVIELNEKKAPITVTNFLVYVDSGFFDGLIFHRVIPKFIIQGGGMNSDMQIKTTNAPIKNEADNGLLNKRGTVAMARTSVVDSATSQFFINLVDNSFLDRTIQAFGYAVFGRVTEGMDVVDKIAAVKTGNYKNFSDVPIDPVIILKVRRK